MEALAESTKLTHEDLRSWPEDGHRHELLEGLHVAAPSPNTRHQRISRRLSWLVESYLQKHPIGELFAAPYDIVLSDFDVLVPDLLFVSAEKAGLVTEANLQGAPDLVVEILSPSSRKMDLVVKRKRYEHFGVEEYWVLDPEVDTVVIFRRQQSYFERLPEISAEAGGVLSTPLLPGLKLPLEEIFRS